MSFVDSASILVKNWFTNFFSTATNQPTYLCLVPEETRKRAIDYLNTLKRDQSIVGRYLQEQLASFDINTLTYQDLIGLLFDTRKPQIFAESQVVGDGSDWNLTELGLLGDISIAAQVTIFDNGHHISPVIHKRPFVGSLIFTSGALLRNGYGFTPADWQELVFNEQLNEQAYFQLYERRLLPVFQYINQQSSKTCSALVTIPGIGCGQFAGKLQGQLGSSLQGALRRFLNKHGTYFNNIKAVYFDPYNECTDAQELINNISFITRPLKISSFKACSQLSHPNEFEIEGVDVSNCQLFSLVAWDHVSWPGNDFYIGSRGTDDGVKSAATDAMKVFTSITGHYCKREHKYLPPKPYINWQDVVLDHQNKKQLRLWK